MMRLDQGRDVVRGVVMLSETLMLYTVSVTDSCTVDRKQDDQNIRMSINPLIHHPQDTHLYCYFFLLLLHDKQQPAPRHQSTSHSPSTLRRLSPPSRLNLAFRPNCRPL